MLATCSRAAFSFFSVILSSTEGETVQASNDTIDRRRDGNCSMVEARSTSAGVEAAHWPLGWSVSLWRFSSSLATDRKATIRPDDSTARLFSEVGSCPGLCFFSPMTGLSLCLGGVGLDCCYNGHARGEEGASLEGPACWD